MWNTQYEDMIALSGNNSLSIKVADYFPYQQKINGFVVGLTGSRVFCLYGSNMTTLELSLSTPMYQYIEKKMYNEAHRVACLGSLCYLSYYIFYFFQNKIAGVTEGDWEELAFSALENMELEVAKLAFIKLQNYNYLALIRNIQVATILAVLFFKLTEYF